MAFVSVWGLILAVYLGAACTSTWEIKMTPIEAFEKAIELLKKAETAGIDDASKFISLADRWMSIAVNTERQQENKPA